METGGQPSAAAKGKSARPEPGLRSARGRPEGRPAGQHRIDLTAMREVRDQGPHRTQRGIGRHLRHELVAAEAGVVSEAAGVKTRLPGPGASRK